MVNYDECKMKNEMNENEINEKMLSQDECNMKDEMEENEMNDKNGKLR